MLLVVNGMVIVGNFGVDVGGNVGKIIVFDLDIGKIIWQIMMCLMSVKDFVVKIWVNDFWKIGGVFVWLIGNYDFKIKIIFWGVGNLMLDFDFCVCVGDNFYSNLMLVFDVDIGKIKYYFQYILNDLWDYDGNNEMILIDDELGCKVWLYVDCNGYVYLINCDSGKCNWVVLIVCVNWVIGFKDNC